VIRESTRALPRRRTTANRLTVIAKRGVVACALAALAVVAPAALAADMNKVIRHVFPAGEEGFDPAAAHDLYSGTVEQMIFEALFT